MDHQHESSSEMDIDKPHAVTSPPKRTLPVASSQSPMADNEGESSPSSGMAGRRSRKSVERFLGASPLPSKKPKRVKEFEGSGIALGEISKIADRLYKVAVKDDALKRLHRILYGSDGTTTTRKKEIRLWNGTVSDVVKKQMQSGLVGAKSVAMLKEICGILNLSCGGDRSSIEERMFDFLLKPAGSTAPLTAKKSKSKKPKKVSKSSKSQASGGGGSSSFSVFMKTRLPQIRAQAGDSMTARDLTELLTMEWAAMTSLEKIQYSSTPPSITKGQTSSEPSGSSSDEDSSSSSSSSSSDDDEA